MEVAVKDIQTLYVGKSKTPNIMIKFWQSKNAGIFTLKHINLSDIF